MCARGIPPITRIYVCSCSCSNTWSKEDKQGCALLLGAVAVLFFVVLAIKYYTVG